MTETPAPAESNGHPLIKADAVERRRPRPNPLTASARRLTTRNISRFKRKKGDDRRDDVWAMFDEVGEQRFLATTLGNRIGQVRLYVGLLSEDDPTADPEPVPATDPMFDALAGFGETPAARAQLLTRMGVNLFMEGDGWFVGIPKDRWKQLTNPPMPGDLPGDENALNPLAPISDGDELTLPGIPLDDLVWRMLSTAEVNVKDTTVELTLDETDTGMTELRPDEVLLIRVWRPHPRKWWQADSPVFSTLPVLRELVGLTMHVSAQIDSRLVSAGMLVVPESAKRAITSGAGADPDADDVDPLQDALIEAAETAISNRDSAAAKVPIVVTVPDDVAQYFNQSSLIKFDTGLDETAIKLREEALGRIALSEDAPPEVLLGTGGMNHWGAWLVKEDVVVTHVEPPAALICDAITSQYLWPVAEQSGMDEERAHRYVVWYSVKHMIARPNKLGDAKDLHNSGVISDETLRTEGGYTDEDAPPEDLTVAQRLVLEMIAKTPSLAETIGIPVLVEQIEAMLGGKALDEANPGSPPAEPESPEAEEPADGPPDDGPADEPAIAASAAPLEGIILEPDDPRMDLVSAGPTEYERLRDFAMALRDDRPVNVAVNIPEGFVHVNVEPSPAEVSFHVEPTPVTVTSPDVHVAAPNVRVDAPTVNVAAPEVQVNTPEVTLHVDPTPFTVDVHPADVTVLPAATGKRTRKVIRDKHGTITGVEEE